MRILIAGAGEVGRHLAKLLARRPHTVVLGANYNRKFGKFLITGGLNGRWLSGISYWSNVVVGGKKSLVMSYFEPQMI